MVNDPYKEAGVDIEAGNAVVEGIRPHIRSTQRPEVEGGFGGFAGLCRIPEGYSEPLLVSGTDGVGTKLLVAQRVGRHDTIGIDLVAMCVNDIVTTGAEPLFFLDYFATGKLAPEAAVQVVKGIAEGCRQSGCALIGGETAEMPGMYAPGHYDLAGFSVGVVERSNVLGAHNVRPGDALIGLAASGIHSNGYSLVRKLCDELDWTVDPGGLGQPLGDALLEPTRIYVKDVLEAMKMGGLHAAAHITGGGLTENLPRVLPDGTGATIDANAWEEPPIFKLLRSLGGLTDDDMWLTFNCGIGLVLVVDPAQTDAFIARFDGVLLGHVEAGVDGVVRA